ncbi:MAG: hypothetical protein JXQ71_03215 [Verrucomicrobia bacterium]|nr:hypothetical protein [Verrucomicrobiota bacterium]
MAPCVPFGSREYLTYLLLLLVARATDFLSTWIATPNLVLEANPIARKLGWRWGILLNLGLCGGFAAWPLPAIIIVTTSALVAARNFQSAWIMHSAGEESYRDWFLERLEATQPAMFLFCVLAQSLLTAAVGAALVLFSPSDQEIPLGIGMGILAYAFAITAYTLAAQWRHHRYARRRHGLLEP